ncbi:hypothetical protein NE602_01490 [Bacteroides cellulosilyticus]|uniref:Uncharacterized protein n=1 Tax=Bacteroides cellulosilyticus TaxID=246787 RepID=A0AAW6MA02_9BACE|nr:hypothetical protein [Bacteroides cellulosilyticus]MCQ4942881.1 hypothetical protein [Bacteroides cellulosilyticus]MDE8696678.1 hypothetical protein [Bacteroides cellulosilyticus]
MNDKFQYRLSEKQKVEIAQNLIDILEKNSEITDQTVGFIGNWILTGPDEKSKAFLMCGILYYGTICRQHDRFYFERAIGLVRMVKLRVLPVDWNAQEALVKAKVF